MLPQVSVGCRRLPEVSEWAQISDSYGNLRKVRTRLAGRLPKAGSEPLRHRATETALMVYTKQTKVTKQETAKPINREIREIREDGVLNRGVWEGKAEICGQKYEFPFHVSASIFLP
jgi:hypothetical protein